MSTLNQNTGDIPQSGSATGTADVRALDFDFGNEQDISPPRGEPFLIVGVGASAGGLDAFTQFLKALPADTGMAFVLVQHLDPHHESQLPEILASATPMPVHQVEDGMHVCPNEVFVIPPNKTMLLEDGVLRLSRRTPGLHLPINAFFTSLAHAQGARAVAIILSGNGSDGSEGLRAIKEECGLTFAQDESTAQHIGMPRSAIASGTVDYVRSPADIARELTHLSHHPFVRPPQQDPKEKEVLPEGDGEIKKIFGLLRASTKVDFSHYKVNTVRRRIGRRMLVTRAATLADYAHLLGEKPEEIRELYHDLLISVTSFFRDSSVFEELTKLLRDLLTARNADEPFRVWVPGCATGEELYSLAICLQELISELELSTSIQLFGTDISDIALNRARAAVYPDTIGEHVSPERLRRFFVRVDAGYQVSKPIREACVFAHQNIATDPPFSHTDLISCRNLLIYLDSTLQRTVLPMFHYSLNPGGLLVLGSAESITDASDLFKVINKPQRIYGRKAVPSRMQLPLGRNAGRLDDADPARTRTTLRGIELQKKADLIIQSKYAPAAVVVDADLQILHIRGRTGFYLEPASGEPTFNLLKMARESLLIPLRKGMEAVLQQNISVRQTGIQVEHRNEQREVCLEITPIAGASAGERYFLIVFEEASSKIKTHEPATAREVEDVPPQSDMALALQVRELKRRLSELQEFLRNANEDQEASLEELRAANEEVRSANEELQSTNEELGTTKEELQSANEELSTVNEELQTRNHDLDALNSDLVNFLSAVDIPFLMVDLSLRLRRFSAAAERVLNVKTADLGHPLTDVQGPVDITDFIGSARNAIQTLNVEHSEFQGKNGRWFSATIRPYRTIDNRIAGAVFVFVDIDPLKRSLEAAEAARNFADSMIETVREPLLVLDADLRIQRATAAFYEVFQVSGEEAEGRLLYDLGNGQWNIPRLREALGRALFSDESFHDFEVEHEFPHIGHRTMRLNARRISQDDRRRVLLAIEDVTQRREAAELRYLRLFETAKDAMLIFNGETERLTDVNPYFRELTGYSREQLIGYRLSEMDPFRTAEKVNAVVAETRSREVVRYEDVRLVTIEGRHIESELVANRYTVGSQKVVQINLRDVTRRNRDIQALRESEERFRLFVDSVRDYALFQLDVTGRVTSWNPGAERLLGYSEAEALHQSVDVLFTPEDLARGESVKELETAILMGKAEDERWHVRKDGSRFFASGVVTTVEDEAGRLRGFAKVMRDMTVRKQAEERLRQQARLLELAQDIIMVRRLDGAILFWNSAAASAFGWTHEEALGKSVNELLQPAFPEPRAGIEAAFLARGHWEGELVYTRRDGSKLTIWSRWALQADSRTEPVTVLEINSDITARKLTDQQLHASLREKEVLLKEVHHRVKNNLQVITSLLSIQSEYLNDSKALAMLDDMTARVRSIATIHEVLYGSSDLSRIDFTDYLNSIAKDRLSFYSDLTNRVQIQIDSTHILLDITQAVPCGLIANELLTNGLKYAFPNNRVGLIEINFRCVSERCILDIYDNGIGLPANIDPQSAISMGLQLVSLLVQQLKGTMKIDRTAGTRFTIEFSQKGPEAQRGEK